MGVALWFAAMSVWQIVSMETKHLFAFYIFFKLWMEIFIICHIKFVYNISYVCKISS